MNKLQPNSFQVPNSIVDDFIKSISGNELKIYLIIVRKTKGWNKEFDGISHSQFIKLGGLGSRNTVVKSLKKLIELNLIRELKQNGNYSLFYLSDPYQKMSMSKNEHVNNIPTPKNEHDSHQKMNIQTNTIKEEKERRELKLLNFEKFYHWLPKENIKNNKWHKKKIKQNLLNNEERTVDNFNDYLSELINPDNLIISKAKEQFKLLRIFIESKTPNQILELEREQTYLKEFKQETNDFIEFKGGLVEVSSSFDNKNYHANLLQGLIKKYKNSQQSQENIL